LGDATLFSHRDGVEATWALFTPILDAWAKDSDTSFPNYPAGSWGPANVATPLAMNLHVGTWEIDFPKNGRNKLD